jgi:nitrite reductase/ring-hydroxylating ferredoxin subunit
MKSVEAAGRRLVVYNVEGDFYATDATCAHQGGPLGDGLLDGCVVTCPWHAWQFDIRTGEALYDPDVALHTHPVTLEGDDVLVEV